MPLIGRELRGIRIISKLGAGGMGTAYLGKTLRSKRGLTVGQEVSVKVLHSRLAADAAAVSRFKLEAGLGLSLNHPNIVKIFQVGTERIDNQPVHFLVQEYIQGATLKEVIHDILILSDPFLRKIAVQIAEALVQIHDKGIIHRDLKPENVFLEEDGAVKIADFGFSYAERSLQAQNSVQGFFGTVPYAAPERFGPDQAGMASDLYSFGVMLYELATGENPFLAHDLDSTINNHIELMPEAPFRKNPNISYFMSFFIMALLEKKPEDRLGPSTRLKRILSKGERARWWINLQPEELPGSVSLRRRRIKVARRTSFVGRTKERALLLSMMNTVIDHNQCRAICIVGETGSGKTRLVDYLLEKMDQVGRPGGILFVECGQGAVKVPYFPLITALLNAFDLKSADRSDHREKLQEKLNLMFPQMDKEVELFTRFLISGPPEPNGKSTRVQQNLAITLFSKIFISISKKTPLIILVENIDEADKPTYNVICKMLRLIKNEAIFLIVTARPGEFLEQGNLLRIMGETVEKNVLELCRLDQAAVSRILYELGFPKSAANGAFGQKVFSSTEGNPYFAIEIARLAESENRVRGEGVDWSGLAKEIPSTIHDVILRRLSQISSQERRFLDFAAVVGMRFRQEEVVEGLGLDFQAAAKTVSSLQNNHALIRQANSGFFRFDHVLIRELLLQKMSPEDKRSYHCRVGERLIALADVREMTGRDYYRACHHFFKGEESRTGLELFLNAFNYLQYKGSFNRASALAEIAASHLAREDLNFNFDFKCELYLKLAEAAGVVGKRTIQFEALKQALNEAQAGRDNKVLALVRLRMGRYYYDTSRFISALNYAQSALSWMDRLNDSWGKADSLQLLSLILKEVSRKEDRQKVLNLLEESLMIREKLKDIPGQAAVLVDMGELLLNNGDNPGARVKLEEAGRLFRTIKNERGMASVLLVLAKLDMEKHPKDAGELLIEAERIALQLNDAALETDVCCAMGESLMLQNQMKLAHSYVIRAHQIAVRIMDVVRHIRSLHVRISYLKNTGDPENAFHLARRAIDLSRKNDLSSKDRAYAMDALAMAYLAMEKPLRAYVITAKILRLFDEEGGPEHFKTRVKSRFDRLSDLVKR